MKNNVVLAGIFSVIALASLSNAAEKANTEESGFPADLVVNLRPQRHIVENEGWINRPVTNIFGGSKIQRVIVTQDWRKVPLSSRIKAIMRLPESKATLERMHAKFEETDFTAIVLLKNGQVVEIQIGEEYGLVTSPEGSAYFKMEKGTVQPTSGGDSPLRAGCRSSPRWAQISPDKHSGTDASEPDRVGAQEPAHPRHQTGRG